MKKFFISAALVSALLVGATSCQSNVDKAVSIAKQMVEATKNGDYAKIEELTKQGEALNLTAEEEAQVEAIIAKDLEKVIEEQAEAASKLFNLQ